MTLVSYRQSMSILYDISEYALNRKVATGTAVLIAGAIAFAYGTGYGTHPAFRNGFSDQLKLSVTGGHFAVAAQCGPAPNPPPVRNYEGNYYIKLRARDAQEARSRVARQLGSKCTITRMYILEKDWALGSTFRRPL